MATTRRYSREFKAKVASAAMRGTEQSAELETRAG